MSPALDVRAAASRALGRTGPDLGERIAAFDEALALGAGRLDPALLERAREVRAKTDERLARGAQAVVAALAGGTGSGKSSLFNALAGAPLSPVGPVRPLTSEVTAWAVGMPEEAEGLLDWLGVGRRHHADPGPDAPEGLVLLDLPDHDSVAAEHRLLVDRFVERVDLFVWVVDPRKYAQRALHAGYLRDLAEHAAVLTVVLNQVDTLSAAERDACLADLRRLLAAEGLRRARVLAASAATGEGVDALRAALAAEVRARRAVGERLAADLRTVAMALQEQTGPPVGVTLQGADALVDALAGTAGLSAFAATAGREYRADAKAATRPLLSRAVWALPSRAARPFRLLRTGRRRGRSVEPPRAVAGAVGARGGAARGGDGGDVPGPGPVAPSPVAVRHALLRVADSGGDGLPVGWAAALREAAGRAAERLGGAVARALDQVSLDPGRRRWWLPFAVVWSLVEAVAMAGAVWLAVLVVLAYLQLPQPPVPDAVGELPWPTALLGGGGLGWLLLGWVRNRLVAIGARRQQRRTEARARAALAATVEREALAPLRAELEAHDALAHALQRAARS